tara:strand:+ start:5255 stop:5644 length:390 start_codon:yes stop_codon:yes gene_type:complete
MTIKIPVSYGELIDKLTILEIKKIKISDIEKLENIENEFNLLEESVSEFKKKNTNKYNKFYSELKEINLNLWEIEDEIRVHEKNNSFNKEFIELARSVYKLNDIRFNIKNEINLIFNSTIAEQKDYEDY